MIDVSEKRDRIVMSAVEGNETPLMLAARVELLRKDLGEALDELEASRKSPMVALFDTTEARAELARIDAAWNAFDATRAYVAARALLDKVLAAIDAGWPVDVEGAALAAAVADGHEVEHLGALPPRAAEGYRTMTRAVLSHVGRAETRKPVAISDAVVEEAAIRAWLAVHDGRKARDDWQFYDEIEKDTYRAQARAVLEYAASIGGVTAPATMARGAERLAALAADFEVDRRAAYSHVPGEVTPPPDDGRAERLTRYRCAALTGYVSAPHFANADDVSIAEFAERIAHAMLAAERSPERG